MLRRQGLTASHGTPYAMTILLVVAAAVIEILISRAHLSHLALVPLSLAVAASVLTGGFGPGVLAVCLSALAMDLIVIEPGVVFRFHDPSAPLEYVGFVTGWLILCLAASGTHRRMLADQDRRRRAERAAFQADRIGQLTAALAQARTPAAAIEAALQEPVHALGGDAGLVLLTSSDGRRADVARSIGYSPEAAAGMTALDAKTPASDAIGRGAPVFVVSPEARAREYGATKAAFAA